MVKSLNTEMAHTTKGTWFREGPIYGNIMVGDKAFEFYNDTKLQDYVQTLVVNSSHALKSALSKMDVSVLPVEKAEQP